MPQSILLSKNSRPSQRTTNKRREFAETGKAWAVQEEGSLMPDNQGIPAKIIRGRENSIRIAIVKRPDGYYAVRPERWHKRVFNQGTIAADWVPINRQSGIFETIELAEKQARIDYSELLPTEKKIQTDALPECPLLGVATLIAQSDQDHRRVGAAGKLTRSTIKKSHEAREGIVSDNSADKYDRKIAESCRGKVPRQCILDNKPKKVGNKQHPNRQRHNFPLSTWSNDGAHEHSHKGCNVERPF
jgi:hypothetical protein